MSLYILILWPAFSALAIYFISRIKNLKIKENNLYETFVIISAATELLLVSFLITERINVINPYFTAFGVSFTFEGLGSLFCVIASSSWLFVILSGRKYISKIANPERYYFFLMFTLSAVIGIFLSSDFLTLFIFYAILTIVSYPLTVHSGKRMALLSSAEYFISSIAGGLFIVFGMIIIYRQIGSLLYTTVFTFSSYTDSRYILIAGICMLLGFGIKTGIYPLHFWLPGAYKESVSPVAILLSGIISKTGLFGIIYITVLMFKNNVIWGNIITVLGVITMIWGAVRAIFSFDIKKMLAHSSMSQIGIILLGLGIYSYSPSPSSAAGVVLHMINHTFIELLLFGIESVIYYNTNSSDLNEIKGFGRGKIFLNAVFLSAMLGISGIPFWCNYISKILIQENIYQKGNVIIEGLFIFCGALTVAYMLKLYNIIFMHRPEITNEIKFKSEIKNYITPLNRLLLFLAASILPAIGLFPNSFTLILVNISQITFRVEQLKSSFYFSGESLFNAFISFSIGALIYFVFVKQFLYKNIGIYIPELRNILYRPLFLYGLPVIIGSLSQFLDIIFDPVELFGYIKSYKLNLTDKKRKNDKK